MINRLIAITLLFALISINLSRFFVYAEFKSLPQVTVAPNIGVLYETVEKDVEDKKYEVAVSGG
jgi:hypothetical protein